MMNVCNQCGLYRADKIIDPDRPAAICPECGYRHPFLRLPLYIVSGASGTGKSTVLQQLIGKIQEFILLDSDILWRSEFNHPETNYRDFFETWLRMCKNIGQSGRPVILFGAGMGVPGNLEPCVERRYFAKIHYLALTCEDEELKQRLISRPDWRKSSDEGFIQKQHEFNRWFKENGEKQVPKIKLVDTTHTSIEETARQINLWSKGNPVRQ